MPLSRKQMVAKMQAKDSRYDQRFITGVLTTGIYCVPSCPSRTPLEQNVDFFETPEQAKASGLRACKRCVPDSAFFGIDPEETYLESVVERLRAAPDLIADVEALSKEAGMSQSRLYNAVRLYYQATPLELIQQARLDKATHLLRQPGSTMAEVGLEAGFNSTSVFYDQFLRANGMAPGAYQSLEYGCRFVIQLPDPYPIDILHDYLYRDTNDPTIQFSEGAFKIALEPSPEAVVEFSVQQNQIHVTCRDSSYCFAAHERIRRMVGMNQNTQAFEAILEAREDFHPLLKGSEGLRVLQTPAIFDSIAWSVLGQQITVRFAMILRQRLFELVGQAAEPGLYPPLQPRDVASLSSVQLLPLQFSQKKSEYLVGIAQRFLAEELDPDSLPTWPATRVERWLLSNRGFGPWSTSYVMMRGCGFTNCLPIGDTGLRSGVTKLYHLHHKPEVPEIIELMKPFEPYRSLATFRLWYAKTSEL